jgi:hypothetical protein
MSDTKTNQGGMTRLLVSIALTDRERPTQASALTDAFQQSIIRNGICAILDSMLANAPIKKSRNRNVIKS